jgi:hypothetical protein
MFVSIGVYLYAGLYVVKTEACATDIKYTGIIDLRPCVLVECYRPFEEKYCLNLPGTPDFHLSWLVVSSLITL